jgi:HEPN domain-containing protein
MIRGYGRATIAVNLPLSRGPCENASRMSMQSRPQDLAQRWLAQAESELAFARIGRREGFHAQACFHSQQAAAMALKALHCRDGARLVTGQSVVELLAPLARQDPALTRLRGAAARLDQLYIPTRYPNGLPGGVPADVFTQEQASEAIAQAGEFVEGASTLIG